MMNLLKGKRNLIKIEVILGFSIALIILGSGAIINFNSLHKLITAVNTISQKDNVLLNLRQLTARLSDEEKEIRSYTLSKDKKYLESYKSTTDSLHLDVARLRLFTVRHQHQSIMADSISDFVAAREGLFGSYLDKRKIPLEEKINNDKYSVPEATTANKNQPTVTKQQDSVATVKSDNKGGVYGFFKNLFGSSKSDKNNVATATSNTNTASATPKKSYRSQEVNGILEQQRSDIMEQWKSWSIDEMLMLQQDKELMDHLRATINNLEENEMAIVHSQANEANNDAYNAINILTGIGALGLICILIFIYLILTDITKSNRLRLQLVEERKKAEKLAKVKEEFLANMSHEIRTPLNSIIGFTEQLAKEEHTERETRFIKAIEKSSDHLLSIVNQILDYSRLEAGKLQRSEVVFTLGEVIKEVYELFRIKAATKNIILSYQVDENISKYLLGDVVGYKQILINLINNAVKFTEKGSVEIKVTPEKIDDKNVSIKTEIIDTGHGIPLEMQDKIFEEFTQADADITRKYGGTGLGLAITQKLVRLLNGSVNIRSRLNEGTTFTVIMPFIKAEKPSHQKEAAPSKLKPHFINKSILLVDDEEMNLMLGKTILDNWNIRTETSVSAENAIEKFNQQHFDLILLDIQMPGISGLEMAKMIRGIDSQHARTIPLVALTANVYNDFKPEDYGINDILIKPFKERELQEKLEKFWNYTMTNIALDGKEKTDNMETANTPALSYDLTYLKNTSGSNPEFVKRMIQSFIQNNWDNISRLNKALNENDLTFIQRQAHKMIPSYRYLHVTKTENELKLLEKLAEEKIQIDKISELICIITEDTHQIITQLSTEAELLLFPGKMNEDGLEAL